MVLLFLFFPEKQHLLFSPTEQKETSKNKHLLVVAGSKHPQPRMHPPWPQPAPHPGRPKPTHIKGKAAAQQPILQVKPWLDALSVVMHRIGTEVPPAWLSEPSQITWPCLLVFLCESRQVVEEFTAEELELVLGSSNAVIDAAARPELRALQEGRKNGGRFCDMVLLFKAVLQSVKPRVGQKRSIAQPRNVRKRPAANVDAHHPTDEEAVGVDDMNPSIANAPDPEEEETAETEDVDDRTPRTVAAASSSTCDARPRPNVGRARLRRNAGPKASADAETAGSLKHSVDRLLRFCLAHMQRQFAEADTGGEGKRIGLAADARSSLVAALEARIAKISGDAAESMRRQKPPRTILIVALWRAAETRGDPRDLQEAPEVLQHRDLWSLGGKAALKQIGTNPICLLVTRAGVKVSAAVLLEIGQTLAEDVSRILMKTFAVTEARRGRHDGGRRIQDSDVRRAIALPRPEGFGMTMC